MVLKFLDKVKRNFRPRQNFAERIIKRAKIGGEFEGRKIFARLFQSVSAIPASAGRQNRKIFFSLIEKNFGGRRLKKCRENFSVLLAEAKRRRAETLGGIQSAKSSGFCSKKVRISSNRHHHNEFEECSASPSPLARASAGSFANKLKGFLKSISSRPAARRRFTNEIRIALWAMSRFFSFAFGERQSGILLNCRRGVSLFQLQLNKQFYD